MLAQKPISSGARHLNLLPAVPRGGYVPVPVSPPHLRHKRPNQTAGRGPEIAKIRPLACQRSFGPGIMSAVQPAGPMESP